MRGRRALGILLLAAAATKIALILTWGDRALLFDEEGYRRAGEAGAAWLLAGGPRDDLSALGRIAWHNPGYAALFVPAELLPGAAAGWIRILQLGAALLSGVLLARFLEPRVGSRGALLGAAALWLHPSHLFYGLTLWPVALATLGTTALLFTAGRWQAAPDAPSRQWELGGVLAVLPFFAAPALWVVPAVGWWVGRARWKRVLGPSVLLLGSWSLALSLALGAFVPLDLAGPRNLALGNNEWVSEGRGSLWGDPEQKALFLAKLAEDCGESMDRPRLRCEARWCLRETGAWVRAHPTEALARAGRRLLETWGPDALLPRHLERADLFPPRGLSGAAAISRVLLLGAQGLVFVALGLTAWGALRRRDLRLLLLGILLWSAPAALSVGLTRMRQPLWPWLIAGAWIVLADARRAGRHTDR